MLEGYSTVSWGTLLNPPNWSDYTAICLCGSKFQLWSSNMIMVINPHFCRVLYNFVCPLIVITPFLVRVLIMFPSPSISFPPLEVEWDRLGRIGVRELRHLGWTDSRGKFWKLMFFWNRGWQWNLHQELYDTVDEIIPLPVDMAKTFFFRRGCLSWLAHAFVHQWYEGRVMKVELFWAQSNPKPITG